MPESKLIDGDYDYKVYETVEVDFPLFGKQKCVAGPPSAEGTMVITNDIASKDGVSVDIHNNPYFKIMLLFPIVFRAELPNGNIVFAQRRRKPTDPDWAPMR